MTIRPFGCRKPAAAICRLPCPGFVDAMNGYFTEDNPAKRAIAVYQPWPTAPQIKGLR
jgi:hypothetical protein